MSVRRLAEVQPESFAFSKASEEKVAFWLNKYPDDRKASAVIPLLWLAQKQDGWVCEPAIREIATRLDMPFIRVYEVATFYTMFNLEPVGEHLIQVCGTTPCWLRGADDLKAVCETRIGKKGRGNVSADGKFSWEEVECLGACSNAPMVQIANADGDYYYEDLTAEALEKILDDLAAGKQVETGPVTGRKASEPTKAKQKVLVEESLFDGSRAEKITLPNAVSSGEGETPEPKAKRVTSEREKTQAQSGKATAKPAPRNKKEADKPAGSPKAPKKSDPAGKEKDEAVKKTSSKKPAPSRQRPVNPAPKKPAPKRSAPKKKDE
nr:NADH-quinone oxidoreductase subunit NuoE [Marinicauda sp. Alg238-R41]